MLGQVVLKMTAQAVHGHFFTCHQDGVSFVGHTQGRRVADAGGRAEVEDAGQGQVERALAAAAFDSAPSSEEKLGVGAAASLIDRPAATSAASLRAVVASNPILQLSGGPQVIPPAYTRRGDELPRGRP